MVLGDSQQNGKKANYRQNYLYVPPPFLDGLLGDYHFPMWLDWMIRLPVENRSLGVPWRVPKIQSTLELRCKDSNNAGRSVSRRCHPYSPYSQTHPEVCSTR